LVNVCAYSLFLPGCSSAWSNYNFTTYDVFGDSNASVVISR